MTTPTEDQYAPIQEVPRPTPDGGSIPFTGFDAVALAVVAVGVIASGWVLRRMARID